MKLLAILSALAIDTISWFYPITIIILAAFLESWLLFQIFSQINFQLLLAIFPLIYLLWLFIFLGLSILSTAVLFSLFAKPKNLEFNSLENPLLLVQLEPTILSYRLQTLITTLPFVNYFKITPTSLKWLKNLVMRAYSSKVHIGKNSVVVTWTQDPDLTYIGDNVVIGSECHLVAHGLNTSGVRVKYFSAPIVIKNNVTIGGNCRIGMGVTIDEGAIVEVGSNVLPFTRIGRGEIWGGNPAVFNRKQNEYQDDLTPKLSVHSIDSSELNAIIANVTNLRLEEITEDLCSDNCSAWDSLAKMAIAASLYDHFNIRVPAELIFKLDSRKSIEQLIATYKDNKSAVNSTIFSTQDLDLELPNNPELLPLYPPEVVTQKLALRFPESTKDASKKIIITATFTAQTLSSTLDLWCRSFDIPVLVEFSEFGQLEQLLLSPNSTFINNPTGLNIVLTRPEDLISDIDPDGMIRASQLLEAIGSYATQKKNLLVSNLPPVVSPFFQGKRRQVEKLRLWWQEQLEKVEGIYILDFASVVEEVGQNNARDASFEAIARAPYSQTVYQRLGIAIARSVRGVFLTAKKVLALDCDNLLWGGVVGEDGIEGLVLSNDHPGRSFHLFQEMLLDLKKRGVLLVIVSKNEEADVWNVFEHHPEMVLDRSDIAAYKINWKEKSSNLSEIASELNVGLDSFVFVDDSPVECLEVETNAPEVTVVAMPSEATRYAETISKLWCFDSLSITSEDKMRTEFIDREKQRQKLQHSETSLESYLESLKLVVQIRFAEEVDLLRVSQLTQKTNQFNLSLIRRSLPEIQNIYKSNSILVLNLKDRFGDYGLVGVAILKQENECLLLDTFLISCRALGRGVEQAFLYTVFDVAYDKNLKTVIAPYHSGARNQQVKAFLLKMGFSPKQSDVLSAQVVELPEKPRHITMHLPTFS